jgi:acylphosphatase
MGPMSKPDQARLHATIHGRVQGVSFRYYTAHRARELDLTGYVRNKPDGTVEVVAEGRRARLEELLSFLRVGPRAAFVTDVDLSWPDPTGRFGRFEVRY